jgi:hypothetical protein
LLNELGAHVTQVGKYGGTALHRAAREGQLEIVECLLKEFRADIDQAGDNGVLPLLLATKEGHLDVMRFLVKEFGADANRADLAGFTPLIAAAVSRNEDVIKWLLKNGVNTQEPHRRFGTPAQISKWHGAPAEHTAYLEAKTHCANPNCSGAGLKKCAKCFEVFFCSKQCQVAAWPAHKSDCKWRVESNVGKRE